MYAPQSDLIFELENGIIRAETRRHVMIFFPDGSIRINGLPPAKFEYFKKSGIL